MSEMYGGNDQIQVANALGTEIGYVGQSSMHTMSRNLVPKDVLHVPKASKNPICVHKLPTNNNVFFSNFTKRLSS
jgi:hypothetical protein